MKIGPDSETFFFSFLNPLSLKKVIVLHRVTWRTWRTKHCTCLTCLNCNMFGDKSVHGRSQAVRCRWWELTFVFIAFPTEREREPKRIGQTPLFSTVQHIQVATLALLPWFRWRWLSGNHKKQLFPQAWPRCYHLKWSQCRFPWVAEQKTLCSSLSLFTRTQKQQKCWPLITK